MYGDECMVVYVWPRMYGYVRMAMYVYVYIYTFFQETNGQINKTPQ